VLPRPELRDAFRRELRGRLMAEARVALVPRETAWTAWLRLQRSWLRPAMAFAVIAIFLLTGGGLAAAGSLPGDPAFALKRAAEGVQLALTPDQSARVEILAAQADQRLSDFSRATSERPSAAPSASVAYADAVASLNAAIVALRSLPDGGGARAAAARAVVEQARERHVLMLNELEQQAPEAARDSIERAKDEAEKLGDGDRQEPANGSGPTPSDRPDHTARPSAERTAEPTGNGDHETDGSRTSDPAQTERPSETERPAGTARPTETPDASERPDRPEPTQTPRPAATPRPSPTPHR